MISHMLSHTEDFIHVVAPLPATVPSWLTLTGVIVGGVLLLVGLILPFLVEGGRLNLPPTLMMSVAVTGLVIMIVVALLALHGSDQRKDWYQEESRSMGEFFLPEDLATAKLLQKMRAGEKVTAIIPAAPQEGGQGVEVKIDGLTLSYTATPRLNSDPTQEDVQALIVREACRDSAFQKSKKLAELCSRNELSTTAQSKEAL